MFSSSNGNENNGFSAVERQEELETVNGGMYPFGVLIIAIGIAIATATATAKPSKSK